MGAKAAVVVFVIIPMLLIIGSAFNFINLTGALNFNDIFSGQTASLLFTQVSDDVAVYFPPQDQFDVYQFFYWFFFVIFLAGWFGAVYGAFKSD